jgi:hypothetical protein
MFKVMFRYFKRESLEKPLNSSEKICRFQQSAEESASLPAKKDAQEKMLTKQWLYARLKE